MKIIEFILFMGRIFGMSIVSWFILYQLGTEEAYVYFIAFILMYGYVLLESIYNSKNNKP